MCNSMTASKVRPKWKDGDGSTKASNKRPSKLRMIVYSGKTRLGGWKASNTTNIPPSGWQRPQRRVQDQKHTKLGAPHRVSLVFHRRRRSVAESLGQGERSNTTGGGIKAVSNTDFRRLLKAQPIRSGLHFL